MAASTSSETIVAPVFFTLSEPKIVKKAKQAWIHKEFVFVLFLSIALTKINTQKFIF